METPRLFHGPTARGAACSAASELGRPVCDPIGDAGLKAAEARQAVAVAMSGHVGDATPTMVVGPLDKATPEAADALLKTLEDLVEGSVVLCLWASCIGGVIPTIRSRTAPVWCPPDSTWVDPVLPFVAEGERLVAAALTADHATSLGIVLAHGKVGGTPSTEDLLLRAAIRALESEMGCEDPMRARRAVSLWRRLRPVLRNPTPLTIAAAMVGDSL